MADIGEIINQNASRAITPAAVGSQVALMSIISIVTIVAFNVLRPKNKVIYEPKVKYHVGNKQPPRISDSLLGWMPPLIRTKEPELVDKLGLDAVTFLRFTRMTRSLYSAIAFTCCAILIPINVSYNLKNIPSADRDVLSMLTIRDVKGFFPLCTCRGLVRDLSARHVFRMAALKEMLRLRQQWFRSPEYIGLLLCADTCSHCMSPRNTNLTRAFVPSSKPFKSIPYYLGAHWSISGEGCQSLLNTHNTAVRELEQVLVTYLKGGKIAKERPTIRIGGFMGMGGTKRDAIDFYTAKLSRTEQAIEDYRQQIDTRKAENYGFASMAAVPYAHIVANLLRKKHPKGTDIALAPNPKDLYGQI
ncbi:late exocytosis, associated with Golgi transport-domain-containing protein [Suillus occidentalis]|nr:late exocytosis, associated with Golgi transport-domain-containing protein [Suillus occidentalis]